MPELPEVQTLVDALLQAAVPGRRIRRASVFWPKTVATSSPRVFCRRLAGRSVAHIRRRGKWIIMDLDDGYHLAVHLRMTGRFELVPPLTVPGVHVHALFDLDDGRRLFFHDTRKFGRMHLTRSLAAITGSLGPEPLSRRFTAKRLSRRLKDRRCMIKPLLLDQTFIAGLGNIYVDEALWASAIDPRRRAHTLSREEVRRLHRSIRSVLRQGIRNGGTSLGKGLDNYADVENRRGRNIHALKVFRRTGKACRRCGNAIERIVVCQRGTHVCPRCQR